MCGQHCYLATLLLMLTASRLDGAVVSRAKTSVQDNQNGGDERSAVDLYGDLLRHLVHAFPEVDDQDLVKSYEKRRMNRGGRDVSRISRAYPSLAAELRAELDRRQLGSKADQIVQPERNSAHYSLDEVERRLDDLEREVKHGDDAKPANSKTKTGSDLSDVEKQLQRMLDGKEAEAEPTTTPAAGSDRKQLVQNLRSEIASTEKQLEDIIDKLPAVLDTPHESPQSPSLESLSQQLAGQQGARVDNSDKADAPADPKTDRLTELASIVKNLIEVNQLAYLQLEDKIRDSKPQQ